MGTDTFVSGDKYEGFFNSSNQSWRRGGGFSLRTIPTTADNGVTENKKDAGTITIAVTIGKLENGAMVCWSNNTINLSDVAKKHGMSPCFSILRYKGGLWSIALP